MKGKVELKATNYGDNKKNHQKQQQIYYQNNREKIIQKQKEYYHKHKETILSRRPKRPRKTVTLTPEQKNIRRLETNRL